MPSFKPPEPAVEPVPIVVASAPQRRFSWRLLLAPLLGMSLVLHIGLLFIPLPAWDQTANPQEEEPPPEEEETTEIISLNDIPVTPETAEPPAPQSEQPQQPRPASANTAAPPRPDQIPENFVVSEDAQENQPLAADPPPEGPVAFDPDRQQALAGGARSSLTGTSFGQLNADPATLAAYLDNYWNSGKFAPLVDQTCFFTGFGGRPQLVDGAYDVLVSNRNVDIFRNEDLPGLIQGEIVEAGVFCNAPLSEIQQEGVTTSFISVLGVGTANTSSAVVIFWSSDPRQ
jgi:hypothetical protein